MKNKFDEFLSLIKVAFVNEQKLMSDALRSEDDFSILTDYLLENELINASNKEHADEAYLKNKTNQYINDFLDWDLVDPKDIKVGDFISNERYGTDGATTNHNEIPYVRVDEIQKVTNPNYFGDDVLHYIYYLDDGWTFISEPKDKVFRAVIS